MVGVVRLDFFVAATMKSMANSQGGEKESKVHSKMA
jgi:hypothetical protein